MLDVHLSGRVIGRALTAVGHDVRAANEEQDLAEVDDEDLLVLATAEGRILVTADVKDFRPIIVAWAAAGRQHAGCILIPNRVRNEHFGRIISGVKDALDAIPEHQDWLDQVYYLK
jgi:uncharacterized protein with PIN domain